MRFTYKGRIIHCYTVEAPIPRSTLARRLQSHYFVQLGPSLSYAGATLRATTDMIDKQVPHVAT